MRGWLLVRRARSIGGVVAGVALLGVALSACSSTPAASGTSGVTSSSAASTTTTSSLVTTTSSSSTSSTSTTTAAPPPCQSGQLSLNKNGSLGAVGTIDLGFAVANSGGACTLDGYPTLTFSGKNGQIAVVVGHSGTGPAFQVPPSKVVVTGTGAGFVVQYYDEPVNGQSSCPTTSSMQVTLPGASSPITVSPLRLQLCGAPNVEVSPVETVTQEHAEFST